MILHLVSLQRRAPDVILNIHSLLSLEDGNPEECCCWFHGDFKFSLNHSLWFPSPLHLQINLLVYTYINLKKRIQLVCLSGQLTVSVFKPEVFTSSSPRISRCALSTASTGCCAGHRHHAVCHPSAQYGLLCFSFLSVHIQAVRKFFRFFWHSFSQMYIPSLMMLNYRIQWVTGRELSRMWLLLWLSLINRHHLLVSMFNIFT